MVVWGQGGYGHGGPGAGRVLPDGVVAEVKLDPGVLQALSFDTLNGFRNIKQLAGRGLLVRVCVCVCLDVCVCVCVCACVCACVHMGVCACLRACVLTCVCVCVCVPAYQYVCACVPACVRVCVCVRERVHECVRECVCFFTRQWHSALPDLA